MFRLCAVLFVCLIIGCLLGFPVVYGQARAGQSHKRLRNNTCTIGIIDTSMITIMIMIIVSIIIIIIIIIIHNFTIYYLFITPTQSMLCERNTFAIAWGIMCLFVSLSDPLHISEIFAPFCRRALNE